MTNCTISTVFQKDKLFHLHLRLNELNFKAFMTVMIQVDVFWVVMTCSVVVGYHRYRSSYSLLDGKVAGISMPFAPKAAISP